MGQSAVGKIGIKINGEPKEIVAATSVSQLLKELRIKAETCAVELNRRVLKRSEYDSITLESGDAIEIVHFVGGGVL